MKRLLCAGRIVITACLLILTANSVHAAKSPVFFYDAPASATPLTVSTVIVDQSGAGNNGAVAQAALPISNDAPVGGGRSFDVSGSNGSVRTLGTQLIRNTAVAAQGGFQMEAWFKADAPSSGIFGSIINYAGTERIQLGGQNTGPGGLGDKNYVEFRISSSGDYVANPDINIADNAWHRAVSKFIVTDMSDPRNLRGDLHLTIDNQTFISRNGLRTRQGDDLNRVISIGSHPTAGNTPAAINNNDDFDGLIYQPKVWLGFDIDPSIPAFKVEINRDSGAVVLRNLGPALPIAGYALRESRGMLTPTAAAWNSLSETSSSWLVMEQSASELAEASITTQSTLAVNGTINLGNVYARSPFSGVTAEILLTNGTVLNGYLEYTGTAAKFADLNFDGTITEADYNLLSANMFGVHTSLTGRQAYQAGDLDGDADTDEFDFLSFKNAFIADNPVGAAALGFAIPEPASANLTALAMIGMWTLGRKRRVQLAAAALAIVATAAPAARAAFDPLVFYNAAVSGSGAVGTTFRTKAAKGITAAWWSAPSIPAPMCRLGSRGCRTISAKGAAASTRWPPNC